MLKTQGIAITDELNKKNHIIPVEAIVNAYLEADAEGIPMFFNHDHAIRTKYN